jgi:type IX secretion system PorP/SprF family membrane protein
MQAQDIHFSQFYASPLNLNPAITGVMPCDMRISAIYRNQWGSILGANAFNTFSAGVEGKFVAGKNDYYGLGAVLWADKAGASSFSTVQGSFSGSYLKRIGGRRSNESYLTAGGQIGFTQRSVKLMELMYGSQWDGDQYNGSLPTLENIGGQRLTFADMSAGLMYFMALDAKSKSNFYVGLAFHHLTRANVSFMNQGFEALYMKTTIHGGGEFATGRRFAFVPSFAVHFQGPSVQSNFGSLVKFDLSKRNQSDQAFYAGLQTRLVSAQRPDSSSSISADALIVVFRIRFGSSAFGLSYDANISRLRSATNSVGAFEMAYTYTLCGMRNRKMGCPDF